MQKLYRMYSKNTCQTACDCPGRAPMIVLDESCATRKPSEVIIQGPHGAHDTLREGIKSVAHDLAPKHPLQSTLMTAMESDEQRKAILGARNIGIHMPLRLNLERSLLQQTSRLAGLPSSNLGVEILTGMDEDFDVPDCLNRTPHA